MAGYLGDILEDEARELGGPSMVNRLTAAAARCAASEFPWNGDGEEPPGRHSVYCAALWQLIEDERGAGV